MIKYQISIHVRNREYQELQKGESIESLDEESRYLYHIKYKGLFSSIEDGLDYITEKFSKIISKKKISQEEIENSTHIVKIKTHKCSKWENLFLTTDEY